MCAALTPAAEPGWSTLILEASPSEIRLPRAKTTDPLPPYFMVSVTGPLVCVTLAAVPLMVSV
jgi:hypothetical protein